jgi:serine/threonine-protein kinase
MPGSATIGPPTGAQPAIGAQPITGIRLIRSLARGGFAEVFEAEQESLGRRVAVKILRPELLGQDQMVQLFEQEARVLARLNHPNVVQVIDRGRSAEGPYFVMEYVEGPTLQELLSQNKVTRDKAIHTLLQAARGLAYAHRNRVVHRDVKPANILVGNNGHIKIGDFGIAKLRAAATERAADDDSDPSGKQLALGTRAFMAPEQRSAFDAVGPAADVYSLGVILHRILTGKLPRGPGRVIEGIPIPERLLPIVERALSPLPEARYPDAGAFREALVNALEGRHIDDPVKAGASKEFGGSGRFELLDVIRQDAWRSVYLVRRGDGERIVVKKYKRDSGALLTVRNLVRIQHPNIVRIHAVGEREDAFIMLMEHLPGGDLRERLVRTHPADEVAGVGRDVASALACAHRHGIVHGNLRPSNVLFDGNGAIRVADFGLPEHYAGDKQHRNWYAAPEGGRTVPADLYALGAILFEMLTATALPPTAEEQAAVLRRIEAVPPELVTVIQRLLAPWTERFESADEVERVLGRLAARLAALRAARPAEPEPVAEPPARVTVPTAEPVRIVAYGPALLGLGGLVFVWALSRPEIQDWLTDLFSK